MSTIYDITCAAGDVTMTIIDEILNITESYVDNETMNNIMRDINNLLVEIQNSLVENTRDN